MRLTLFSEKEFTSIVLPEKCMGHYWLRGRISDMKMTNIISVEALRFGEDSDEPKWTVKSNRRFKITDKNNNVLTSVVLLPLKLYRIQSADGSARFTLFTEPLSPDRKKYSRFELTGNEAVLVIGRDASNSICYPNEYVSARHAELKISNNGIIIRDLNSTNKTYVNGKSVSQSKLKIGDTIYILGLQVIVTNNGIYLNNPGGIVKIQCESLKPSHIIPFEQSHSDYNLEEDSDEIPCEFYYRAPRFKYDIDTFELKIDAPPSNQNADEMPMIMVIGPSLTMGMASVATGLFSVTNAISRGDVSSAIPSMVMCASMLLGTTMWPLITKSYQKRNRRKKEARRQETYREYLANLERIIAEEVSEQERILRENDVNISVRIERILSRNPQIWERTPKHTDFLLLRLGHGNLPLKADIQYPERKFTVEQDNLTELMYQFGEKKRWLNDVPVCLSVKERYISGIYGERNILLQYAKNFILQIAAMHSYDEVKLVILYDESSAEEFSFVRWLPHTMNNERTVRYIAGNSDEVKELSSSLDSIIEYRKELSENILDDEMPFFVVFCLDKELSVKAEFIHRILEHKKNIRFSVISMFERLVDLPKECTAVAEIGNNGTGSLTYIGDVSEPPIEFNADIMPKVSMHRVASVLANTFVDINDTNFMLPKKYTFFEMLGIGMIEHLNLSDNWSSNDPTRSLAASVGVDKYGEMFKLDLHERVHGPHGLIAGMTGSGKSEFIITYILSLAVSFHPYEVAFILIDYKGGGMAKSFENIPHTAGVITNLDGNGIKRSLASMRSELHRRERIFRDTSTQHNISNIDIYKYQKLYREGKVSEPLPHLFIVSDEFAELKKEQPDFMTELTSTARVGRSLGVHLILATQKPGGIVDDQIRSNSRFRVCLKVQDSGDSMEMLGRTEAAALVDTGRFYLQVGYNELFEIGQSAWAGAPYYPSPKVIKERDDSVSVINTNGRVVAEANINRFAMFKDPKKQLDVITEYINKHCEAEKIKHWKMWLDPIAALIYIDSLAVKYGEKGEEKFVLDPIVGEYDDPAHQSQGILRIPITEEGNVIVYGSTGNGKAMFIEAMCYSIMKNHTPEEVNIYILDFGAETFSAFEESPHIGDVIFSHETEKVINLLKLMLGKLETRRKILSQFGGNMVQYNQQADKPEPNLIVIINNYAAFAELFEEKTGDINYLTREGIKYGIYFILACTGVNNVRFSMLQNFKSLYCLQLNNADDYSTVVGKTEGLVPEKYKGRGIYRNDSGSLLEFQTASITKENPPYSFIRSFSKALSKKYSAVKAAKVPVLPDKVTIDFLSGYVRIGDLSKIPIGIEKSTLEIFYYNFSESVANLVLAVNQEWQSFTDSLCLLAAGKCEINTMVLAPAGKTTVREDNDKLRVCNNAESCVKAVNEIFNIVLNRNNEYKTMEENEGVLPEYEPLLVIIQSMSLLKTMLERYKNTEIAEKEASDDTLLNRLHLAIEKSRREYKVHFIIAESINSLTPLTVENWYKEHINGNNGIWVGGGISSQYRLSVNKKPKEYSQDIDSGFGFAIENSIAAYIKFLQ